MGDDIGLKPSAAGTSVTLPETVLKQIIGTRVTWTVDHITNPLPDGPRTVVAAAILKDKQFSGALFLMPRRVAGDSEICEVPYQNTPIDGTVEIIGEIASFRAGFGKDGNIVVVVDVIDVSGCEAKPESSQPDLAGRWDYKKTSSREWKGVTHTMELIRDASCDRESFMCYTYQPPLNKSDKTPPVKWKIFIRDSVVLVCIVSHCSDLGCTVILTDKGQIEGQCKLIGNPAGEFTMSRTK
jgi:hypothetical protein